jgi:hypothetical protein
MPSIDSPAIGASPRDHTADDDSGLSFPPVRREHILNCSYDRWYPKYKSSCLPSCIIPLPDSFIDYLNEDGIILADDDDDDAANACFAGGDSEEWRDTLADPEVRVDNTLTDQAHDNSNGDSDDDEPAAPAVPPNQRFPDLHRQIKEKITELGGAVVPKLNWSTPKDATWISKHQNTLKCTSPNDIYVLLKSSSFVSHDLDHAFDECAPLVPGAPSPPPSVSYVLVLRPFFDPHPAMEFRCFVKQRTLVGATPRSVHYYRFLLEMRDVIVARIDDFFEKTLRFSFPDDSFVFDVYLPEDSQDRDRLGKVCLVDINPWAPKTDTLLWGWEELLEFEVPKPILGAVVGNNGDGGASAEETTDDDDDDDDDGLEPELRLVEKHDPAGYNFNSAPYSAHKLPKEVVDASAAGSDGMMEFLERWKEMQAGRGGEAGGTYAG